MQMNEPERLLRLPAVSEMTGMGRTAIYQRVKSGEFPQPIRFSSRYVAWRQSEVQGWIFNQIEKAKQ